MQYRSTYILMFCLLFSCFWIVAAQGSTITISTISGEHDNVISTETTSVVTNEDLWMFAGHTIQSKIPTGPEMDMLEKVLSKLTLPDTYYFSPTIDYTATTQSILQIIFAKKIPGNEAFFASLFPYQYIIDSESTPDERLWNFLQSIPAWSWDEKNYSYVSDDSIAGELLMQSFDRSMDDDGDIHEDDDLIRSVREVVEQLHSSSPSYTYPPLSELVKASVYRNGVAVPISEIIDQFDYSLAGDWYGLQYKNPSITYAQALTENSLISKNILPKNINYNELLRGLTVPDLSWYDQIPADAALLRVENPDFFRTFITDKDFVDPLQIISTREKEFFMQIFGIKNMKSYLQSVKKPFTLALLEMSLDNPQFVLMLDPSDKGSFANAKNFYQVEIWNRWYIAADQKVFEKMQDRAKNTPLSKSSDFRFTMAKKTNITKDIFVFIGDRFFERMSAFDSFISFSRNIDSYKSLTKLQTRVQAYRQIYGKNPKKMKDIWIPIDTENRGEFTLKKWVVYYRKICSLFQTSCQTDLSTISRRELWQYQKFVLNYREIWRSNLDPLSIIINPRNEWFSLDFSMMPIPDQLRWDLRDIAFLRWISGETIDIQSNKKIRLGSLGGIVSIDLDKIHTRALDTTHPEVSENAQEIEGTLESVGTYLLQGQNLRDFVGNEAYLSFGDFDPATLSRGYNPAWGDMDITVGLEMKSAQKAQEFTDLLKKSIETWSPSRKKLPKTISYKNTIIQQFSIDDPLLWDMTLCLATIDNILMITPNIQTIKKNIDFSQSQEPQGAQGKIHTTIIPNNTLLYLWLDRDKVLDNIENLKIEGYTEEYIVESLMNTFEISSGDFSIQQSVRTWYKERDAALIKGLPIPAFVTRHIWVFMFSQKGNEIWINIDRAKISKEILDTMDDLTKFPILITESNYINSINETSFYQFSLDNMLASFLSNINASLSFHDNEAGIVFHKF